MCSLANVPQRCLPDSPSWCVFHRVVRVFQRGEHERLAGMRQLEELGYSDVIERVERTRRRRQRRDSRLQAIATGGAGTEDDDLLDTTAIEEDSLSSSSSSSEEEDQAAFSHKASDRKQSMLSLPIESHTVTRRQSPRTRIQDDCPLDQYEVRVPPGPLGMLLEPREDSATADCSEEWMLEDDLVVSLCVGWRQNPLAAVIPVGSTLLAIDGKSVRGESLDTVGIIIRAAAERQRVMTFASPQVRRASAASDFLAMKRQASREFPRKPEVVEEKEHTSEFFPHWKKHSRDH